jgi:hypothetical protein
MAHKSGNPSDFVVCNGESTPALFSISAAARNASMSRHMGRDLLKAGTLTSVSSASGRQFAKTSELKRLFSFRYPSQPSPELLG